MDLKDIDASAVEAMSKSIISRRVAWAEFEDGSIGLTTITEEEAKELGLRRLGQFHDPLPKHYRDQGKG